MTEMEVSVTADGLYVLLEFTANESIRFSVLLTAEESDKLRAGLGVALRIMHYERPS